MNNTKNTGSVRSSGRAVLGTQAAIVNPTPEVACSGSNRADRVHLLDASINTLGATLADRLTRLLARIDPNACFESPPPRQQTDSVAAMLESGSLVVDEISNELHTLIGRIEDRLF
jgi:hypothetical protein